MGHDVEDWGEERPGQQDDEAVTVRLKVDCAQTASLKVDHEGSV